MRKHSKTTATIKGDLIFLGLKIIVFILLLVVIFLFIFGIARCCDNSMSPSFKNGDLAIYYRLQKEYQVSDVVVLKKDGEEQLRRVIAKAGDQVDITEEGLKVNGYLQQEDAIYTETLPYIEGITFPIILGQGEYFVLGDNRTTAKDSRIYGVVKQEEIKGTIITLLRRRGF